MKKHLSFLLAILILISLQSCGGGSSNEGAQDDGNTGSNQPPILYVSPSNLSPTPGEPVDFSVVIIDDVAIVSAECDFDGDNTFETEIADQTTYTHTYDVPGSYNVNCRATDNENATSSVNHTITVDYQLGAILKTIDFPNNVSAFSDIIYNDTSKIIDAFVYDTDTWYVSRIVQINSTTGEILKDTPILNPDFFMNHASEFTKAGDYYFGTSFGTSNGVKQSYVYRLSLDGEIIDTFPCPAVRVSGYCEGLAWDGKYLWSGASDSKSLTQFDTNGTVINVLENVFETINITDIDYDVSSDQLVALKNSYVYWISPLTGVINKSDYAYGARTGAWDRQIWWSIANTKLQIEGIYLDSLQN